MCARVRVCARECVCLCVRECVSEGERRPTERPTDSQADVSDSMRSVIGASPQNEFMWGKEMVFRRTNCDFCFLCPDIVRVLMFRIFFAESKL